LELVYIIIAHILWRFVADIQIVADRIIGLSIFDALNANLG